MQSPWCEPRAKPPGIHPGTCRSHRGCRSSHWPPSGSGGSASSSPGRFLRCFGPQNPPASLQGPESGGVSSPQPTHPMSLRRFVIQLLEDLVFFVSDVPNNGQNVLDIVVTKPNRERQKLMREQNILKQVGGPGALHPSRAGTSPVEMSCPAQGHSGGRRDGKPHGGGSGLQLMPQCPAMHGGLVWSRTQH